MNRTVLAVGILFLFIASTVTPAVISYDEPEEDDDYLENLAFYCPDKYGSSKLEYYNECHQRERFDVEEDVTQWVEPPQTGVSGGPMDSPWPMKCHDTRHTGLSLYNTADNPYDELWKFKTEGWMRSGVIIGDDGVLYFGSYDFCLYAVYPNGTLKWRYGRTGMWIDSTPAIAEDGTVYIGSWGDYLHAVYPNGTMKWKFDALDTIASSPAIGDDGTIYFGTMWGSGSGGVIHAVNPNGTSKWSYKTGYHITSCPAIADDGTIYIGSFDHYLYALYPNGTLRWRFGTGNEIRGHPSIAEDGTIYISSWDDYLYAIYLNGTMKWKTNTGWGSSGSAAIADDGTIYLFTDIFRAFYPTNGTIKWSLELGDDGGRTSPAISADGTIYTCNDDGKCIIAIDPNGNEIWRKQISNLRAESSPIIGEDGTIYVGSSWKDDGGNWFGYLHAFGELDPDAPEAPIITGETNGEAGVEYDYTFCSIDPNGDDVYYYIEWGDGEFTDWIGPFASGEEVVVSHTWDEQDTYTIKARAKDTDNLWGPWGELEVSMPVNQQSSHPWFHWLLYRFPNAFPILRQILGL